MKSVKDEVDLNSEAIKKAMDNIKTELTNATSDQSNRLHKDAQVSRDKTTKDPFVKSLSEATPSFWNAGEGGVNKLDTDKYGVVPVPADIALETLKIPDGAGGERTLTNASIISYTLDANGDFLFEVSHQVVKGATKNKDTKKGKGFSQSELSNTKDGSDEGPDSMRTGFENKSEIVKVISEKVGQIAAKLKTSPEELKARATKKKTTAIPEDEKAAAEKAAAEKAAATRQQKIENLPE